MNDQELNCFLTAAKYLNFSDAANHLYLSQSAFSRNIAKLEKELQVTLFYRDTKNVELTAAGYFLSQQFTQLYQDYLLCVQKAKLLEEGLSGKLYLGLLDVQAMEPEFQRALRNFNETAKDIHIEVKRNSYYELLQALFKDELDGIVTLISEVEELDELDYITIATIPSLIAIPALHPLAQKETITIEDIKDETFIAPSTMANATHKYMADSLAKFGVVANLKFVNTLNDQLIALEAGQGLSLLNEHNLTCYSPSLVVKEASFFPPTVMVFAYKKSNSNPALHRFLDDLKKEQTAKD